MTMMPNNYTYWEMRFGRVAVGTRRVQKFVMKNELDVPVEYRITRSSLTNPIYHVFDISNYSAIGKPRDKVSFKVIYRPNVPGTKNLDYFQIIDDNGNLHKLLLIGESIGPVVCCSIKYLTFMQDRKKTIELTNESDVPAVYQFDDNEDGIFQVDKMRGTIQARAHVQVTVIFSPKSARYYTKELTCLLLYHEPIIVHLFGICTMQNKYALNDVHLRRYPFPREETAGIRGYLSDSVQFKTKIPPVSLTENYMDFGQSSSEISQTLATSLSNHLDFDIEIEWEDDENQTFHLNPRNVRIPALNSALFECTFTPTFTNNLFGRIITGQIFWKHEGVEQAEEADTYIDVPIPITLRTIGHSFLKDQRWIPQVSIFPENIILPLCLPGHSTWTSFIIRTHGHLPVLFKLLPPKKTNYVLKPMCGLIREHQIITVQLQVYSEEKNSYIEKWNIELNGEVEKFLPIYIKTCTDSPSVLIGIENLVEFKNTQIGCENVLYVPLKNASCFHLHFKFDLGKLTNLLIQPEEAELLPNEEIFIEIRWIANAEGSAENVITCLTQAVFAGKIHVGSPVETPVIVQTHCSYSELCSIPKSYETDELEYGAEVQTSFYLFNFGESDINFTLFGYYHDPIDGTDTIENGIIFSPRCGKCGAKEKILVKVNLVAKQMGEHELKVKYYTRLNDFTERLTVARPIQVFTIRYRCINASLQIQDILEHNFGPLFSKTDLWEFCSIDLLNDMLRSIIRGEKKELFIRMPECEMDKHREYYISFLVKNPTSINVPIVLKRKKVCDCRFGEEAKSFSLRQKVTTCPHKEMATLKISKPNIAANTAEYLTFHIKYVLYNAWIVYDLILSNERMIEIAISISSLLPNDLSLSTFKLDDEVDFGSTFLGLREPPMVPFWLYNNTSVPINYLVDTWELLKLCQTENNEIFTCLNTESTVKPQSIAPILFRFRPAEEKIYKVIGHVMLGGSRVLPLRLTGEGSRVYKQSAVKEARRNICIYGSLMPIALSTEHIVIEPMLVWNFTEKLISIKNTTDSDINYVWEPFFIPSLVQIEVINEKGLLKPKESHMLVLKITTFGESCKMRTIMTCRVFDETQLLLHLESKALHKKRQKNVNQEFTITEKGVTYPVNEVQIIPAPEEFAMSVLIEFSIIGSLDKDTCLPVANQFKQMPYCSIDVDPLTFAEEHFKGSAEGLIRDPSELNLQMDRPFAKHLLEGLVADAVFSNYFKEIAKLISEDNPPLYSQIKLHNSELRKLSPDQTYSEDLRCKLLKMETIKSHTRPQLFNVDNIFQEALISTVHETFQLGPPTSPKKNIPTEPF